ncbi:MAG: hypothetical protein ABI377_02690 [Devosia sp.]
MAQETPRWFGEPALVRRVLTGIKGGMRLVLRILGTWLLGLALILLIIDGTKSLGADTIVTTSLGDTWNLVSAASLAAVKNFIDTRFFGPVLDPLLGVLLSFPGFAVLGIPGILLAFAGRSRRSRRFVKQDQF